MSHVFISYSRKDKLYVQQLAKNLAKNQFTYWYDTSIEVGQNWSDELRKMIVTSSAIILVMTPSAAQSEWVNKEIEIATDKSIPIIPLQLEKLGKNDFKSLKSIQYFSVVGGKLPDKKFYTTLRKIVPPNSTYFIENLVSALKSEKDFEEQESSEKFSDIIPSFIGVRQACFDINFFYIIKADNLNFDEIQSLHQTFFEYMSDWRPSFFLARSLKKTGVLCFIFEETVSQETIDFVLKQHRDTEQDGLVLIDGVRTVSWVLSKSSQKGHWLTTLLPIFPPAAGYFYPGKEWLDNFVKNFRDEPDDEDKS